jgi:molybdopterin-containing oxidoreductase family membrane subunit
LPLIPDAALMRDKLSGVSRWRRWIYRMLSFGWRGTPDQKARLERAINIMAILILPIAVMVHTVVSWIFAMTLRPGWNSTIFGPYFVAGALASGAASVILAMAAFRRLYHLENYITLRHFRNMAALVFVLDLVYIYFNLAEYATTAYKMQLSEKALLTELFTGPFAPLFWFTQVVGLIVPAFLLVIPAIKPLAKLRRIPILRPVPLAVLASLLSGGLIAGSQLQFTALTPFLEIAAGVVVTLFVLSLLPGLQSRPIVSFVIATALIVIQAWLKRYIIVVPVFENPFLPIRDPTLAVALYTPTWVEWAITAGSLAGFAFAYFLFSRLFPIVSIWETAHDAEATVEQPHALPRPATASTVTSEA